MNCQVCQIPFECNPSSQHIPCVGSCGHVVCRGCISPKCPRCHKDSFSPNSPIINHGMIEFMLARDLDSIHNSIKVDLDSVNNSIKVESGEDKDSTEGDNFERIGSEEEKIDCSDVMTIDSFSDDDMNELNSLAAGTEKLSDIEFILKGEEMDSGEGDQHERIDSQERKIESRLLYTIEDSINDSNYDPCSDDPNSDDPSSDDPSDDPSYNSIDNSSDDEMDDRIEPFTAKVGHRMTHSSSYRRGSDRNIHTKKQVEQDNASTSLDKAEDILTIDDSSDDEMDKVFDPFKAEVSHRMTHSSSNRAGSDNSNPKKKQVKRDNASTGLYEAGSQYAQVKEESRSVKRNKDTTDILTIDDSSDDEMDKMFEPFAAKVSHWMTHSSSNRAGSDDNTSKKQHGKRDNVSTSLNKADSQYAHVEEKSRSVKLNKDTTDILTIDDSSDDEVDKMFDPFAAKVGLQMARSSSRRGSDENTSKKQHGKRDNKADSQYAHVEEKSRSFELNKDTADITIDITIDDCSDEEMLELFAAKVDHEMARSESHRGVAGEKRDIALITTDLADDQLEHLQDSQSYQKNRHEKGAKDILTIYDSSDDETMEPLRFDGGNQTSRSRSNKGVGDNNTRTKQYEKQVIASPAPEVTGGQQERFEKVRSYQKDKHEEINCRENMIDINVRLTFDSNNEEIDEIMGPLTARVDDQTSHSNSCSTIAMAQSQNGSYRLPTPASHWYGEYSPTRSVYRVSQHSKDAESDKIAGGKYGERPAEWSVENGWITIMARSVPNDVKSNEIKKYLCKTEVEVIKKACEKELFWEKMKKKTSVVKRYINTDRKFVQMSTGDIIALRMPGPAKKGIHFFGIVESDDLHVWTHEQLLDQGWPCNHILTGSPWWRDRRVMLRKVKWYRWGYTRELPGSEQVCRWLCENMPLWLIENPKDALNVLSGIDFINCTNSIDDLKNHRVR